MINALVRGFLGKAGSGLLDFYIQYSLWINLLLFTYAVLVIFARRNYVQVGHSIVSDLIQSYGDKLAKKSRAEIRALLLKWNIPWEAGLHVDWFPFISYPQGILLRLKLNSTLQKMFPIDALVELIVQQTSSRRS